MDLFNIDANILNGLKDAENQLEKKEKRKDDLGDLPATHPLRLQMEEAKQRHEKAEELRKKIGKRKGKKVTPKTNRKAEDEKKKIAEQSKKIVTSVKHINNKMDGAMKLITEIQGQIVNAKTECREYPSLGTKLLRIERMLKAFNSGFAQSKIKPIPLSMMEDIIKEEKLNG